MAPLPKGGWHAARRDWGILLQLAIISRKIPSPFLGPPGRQIKILLDNKIIKCYDSFITKGLDEECTGQFLTL